MTSPAVWDDALARATTAGATLGLAVVDIAAQDLAGHAGPYVQIETATSLGDRLGLGEIWQEETGQIWLHIMVRRNTGSRPALVWRKALSTAFRAPQDLAPGLVYHGQSFDPPDSDDKALWIRFSLAIDYVFQDRLTPAGES